MHKKSICIVGGGPAGLAALKTICDTREFLAGQWTVSLYEARDKVGGIWNPEPSPQGDLPLTPLYDSMTTNIPHPVMAYPSLPFPPSTPLFPPARTVETYLDTYVAHFQLAHLIHLNTTVCLIDWNAAASTWKVVISDGATRSFDLLVVANGHFRVPLYPPTQGLDLWLRSARASHSVWYRNSSKIRPHSKIIVVGSGPSGMDIAAELRRNECTVIHSTPERRIENYQDDCRTVAFEDGSKEGDIDLCILATGYQMSFPFLPPKVITSSLPPSRTQLPSSLHNSSYDVFPLAKHIFPLRGDFNRTSLAFMGLLLRGTPFSLFEAQAEAIVRVFRNPGSLDVELEAARFLTRAKDIIEDDDIRLAKMWHKPTEALAFDYRDELYAFSGSDRRFKYELRRGWNELVGNGESDAWLEGVGHGGQREWVTLMERVLVRGVNLN
ncbi:FAD/NAD(P)-binding domain-containing protein [Hymenopellis radicata]|nr:FAD/NAD(P)-binding domain-containing protein [Hymenopellis radicata]